MLVLSILYNLFSINEAKSQAHTESIGNTSTALFCLLNLMFEIDFIENEDFVMFVCVWFIDRYAESKKKKKEIQNVLLKILKKHAKMMKSK